MIKKVSIRNYKAFQSVELDGLSPMSVFIGANGSGKSTLFDVFAFLRDALLGDATSAVLDRNGWAAVHSRESVEDFIAFELHFTVSGNGMERLAKYRLLLKKEGPKVVVASESLDIYDDEKDRWRNHLDVKHGVGYGNDDGLLFGETKLTDMAKVELESPDILALKPLSQYAHYRSLSTLRKLLESFIIFDPSKSSIGQTGYARGYNLAGDGANMGSVAKYLSDEYPEVFRAVIGKMRSRIPGLAGIAAVKTEDGRIVLQFKDATLTQPFQTEQTSDGTLKLFVYLLLIHHPEPKPLLAIEEPENYLHPELQYLLADELRVYARTAGQVLVTTHSPEFLNALRAEELFGLDKVAGYTRVRRIADDEKVRRMYASGDQLGYLWREGYFSGGGVRQSVK